ncbi:hypothetical protein H6F75_01005 [Nodosilinea sp. FACHB-131]|uniref:hypothetical protein n=1 Tax=Cyanophyceae TaxID=3028117 RepID=UPI001688DB8A|nr:hypothetical protein [Nodosilinea sp. FACHB-131]MBD1872048.1 hypothetical protein [Nodosilinea sp. FACHB-131]
MNTPKSSIGNLVRSSYSEFSDIADYIWKTPKFIKQEMELEIQKLAIYYPNSKKDQAIRWKHESRKLFKTFPYLNSTSNLFSVVSIFEVYLLRLGHELEQHTAIKLRDISGQGSMRIFKYLRALSVQPENLDLWLQVQSAIKIRNCFVHACGILSWSRDKTEIQNIYKNKLFLSREHREKHNFAFDEVTIFTTDFGERLEINNMYAWKLSFYFRDFFVELCRLSISKLA